MSCADWHSEHVCAGVCSTSAGTRTTWALSVAFGTLSHTCQIPGPNLILFLDNLFPFSFDFAKKLPSRPGQWQRTHCSKASLFVWFTLFRIKLPTLVGTGRIVSVLILEDFYVRSQCQEALSHAGTSEDIESLVWYYWVSKEFDVASSIDTFYSHYFFCEKIKLWNYSNVVGLALLHVILKHLFQAHYNFCHLVITFKFH